MISEILTIESTVFAKLYVLMDINNLVTLEHGKTFFEILKTESLIFKWYSTYVISDFEVNSRLKNQAKILHYASKFELFRSGDENRSLLKKRVLGRVLKNGLPQSIPDTTIHKIH